MTTGEIYIAGILWMIFAMIFIFGAENAKASDESSDMAYKFATFFFVLGLAHVIVGVIKMIGWM